MNYNIEYKFVKNWYAKVSKNGVLKITIPRFLRFDKEFHKTIIEKWNVLLKRFNARKELKKNTISDFSIFWKSVNKEKFLENLLKEKLYDYSFPILEKYADLLWKKVSSLQIKKLKSKWWSCSSDWKIILNLNLIRFHKKYIDYVIIHEVCHLVEPNHWPNFRELVKNYCTDYKKLRKDMKEFVVHI